MGLAATGFGSETVVALTPGMVTHVGPYDVKLESVTPRGGPNYRQTVARMTVTEAGRPIAVIEPARRQFVQRQTSTTEAGIVTLWLGQLYVSISDPDANGAVPAQLYWKPLVTLIWLGAIIMAFGGTLSLADRRLRFGAPSRARGALPAGARGA
jgi:cytochrome c-type biogenesis protein CcmF